MEDEERCGPDDGARTAETDGGVAARSTQTDYLDARINLFKPSTPFMRDHLKLVWGSFVAWALFVFGPVTATAIAPELMTETMVLGFQLHFFLTALGAPFGALLLAGIYARRRDTLDRKYGISHENESPDAARTPAADGGETNT